MNLQRLRLKQTSRLLKEAASLSFNSRPKVGWLRVIREALCIPLRAQAKKLGVSSASLYKAEKSEAESRITLGHLQKLANALDCELVYALVPRKELEEIIDERAEQIAQSEITTVTHTMKLEDQQPDDRFVLEQVAERKRELLEGNWTKLWP